MVTHWIVLDNCQAQPKILDRALRRWPDAGLTLTPFTLAEIVLRPGGPSALRELLARCDQVRWGLEQRDVHSRVLGATEVERIRSLHPFLDDPDATQMAISLDAAKDMKANHKREAEALCWRARAARCRLTEAKVPRLSSFAEAENAFAWSPGALLPALVLNTLTDRDQVTARVEDPMTLYCAVMNNAFLGRYWRVWLGYLLSISDLWVQSALRGRSTGYLPRQGDPVDLGLFLYAGDGDIVLTSDRRLGDLASVVDPKETVRVGTLESLV